MERNEDALELFGLFTVAFVAVGGDVGDVGLERGRVGRGEQDLDVDSVAQSLGDTPEGGCGGFSSHGGWVAWCGVVVVLRWSW